MHEQLAFIGKFQSAGEMAARTPHALRHRIDLAVFAREEGHDAIRFGQLAAAKDDAASLITAWRRRVSPKRRRTAGRWCRLAPREYAVRACDRRATACDRPPRSLLPHWEAARTSRPCNRQSFQNLRWA